MGNLDGHDDIALACPADNDSTGTVFVVFGGDGFPETNIISLESDMMLGVDYIQLQGGSNGDGFADVVIGAPQSSCAYVYYGMASTALSASIVDATTFGPTEGFRLTHDQSDLGSSVAGIGDINDDGYDDVAVGAPAAATVCVVFGNEYMRNDDGFALTGTNLGAQAGAAVALGTFDVNNDGIDDLMVGEPGAHQAFVLFGISVGTVDTHEPSQMPTTDTWAPTSSPKPTGGFPTPRPTKQPTPRPTPMPTGAFPTPMPTKDMPTPRPSTSTPTSPISPTAPTDGGGSTGSSSSSGSGSSSSSNSGGGVDAASAGIIIGGVVAGAAVLFIMAMVVYRNKSRDEQASLADDVDRITIEAEAARPQPTPVDQASMSSGVNDMSMVEAPASMVTDVQEKIIEADL